MKSFPFDSEVTYGESGEPIYDRASKSQDLRDYFSLMYTDGVFPNPSTGLQVTTSTQSMSVTVKPGAAIIQGAFAIEDRDRTIVFEAADENMDRIDSVVIRLNTNLNYRTIDLYVVKGKAAAQPAAPALTREGGIYELRLANVFVAKGTTTISKARITDTRLNSRDCGIAACNPQKVETSAIYDQYQASLDEWLQYVADCIDGTTAGNLQKQISALNAKVPFGFGVDQEGNAGYIKPGEDHITLFGSGTVNLQTASIDHQSGNTATILIASKGTAHMQLIVHRTVDASFPAQTYTVEKNDTVIKTETISGPNQTKTIDISAEVNVGDVITFTSTSGSYLYVFASLYVETAASGTGGAPVYNVVLERLQETEDKANEASEKAAQIDSVKEEITQVSESIEEISGDLANLIGVKLSDNRFDDNAKLVDTALYASNGKTYSSSGKFCSDFCDVSGATKILWCKFDTNAGQVKRIYSPVVCYSDASDDAYLGQIQQEQLTPIDLIPGTKFVRFSSTVTDYEQHMLLVDSTAPSEFVPFERKTVFKFIDKTMTEHGKSADAGIVGDKFEEISSELRSKSSSEEVNALRRVVENFNPSEKASTTVWYNVGDSWSQNGSTTDLRWWYYVAQDLNLEVHNLAYGGTGYWSPKAKNNIPLPFFNQIATSDIPSNFTGLITLFGSGNDASATYRGLLGTENDVYDDSKFTFTVDESGNRTYTQGNTYGACVRKAFDTILEKAPLSHVLVLSPCPWEMYAPSVSDNRMMQCIELLEKICKIYGFPFVNCYWDSGLRPWDDSQSDLWREQHSDGATRVHPTNRGHRWFYPFMREHIRKYVNYQNLSQ